MEWVETTARTVEEAKDLLLDRLGVHDDEAEFEILEEPKPGLFGRTRGTARVRARVRPKAPRPKDDRRRRNGRAKGRDGGRSDAAPNEATDETPAASERTAEAPKAKERPAADAAPSRPAKTQDPDRPAMPADEAATACVAFVTQLLDELGLVGSVTTAVTEEGDVELAVAGSDLGRLIGPRGGMIRVVEELCRTRLQHLAAGGSTPRVRVDVGGYRQIRRSTLEALVDEAIEQVRTSGSPVTLDVVLSSERKVVHDRIGETATDLTTRSEGEDPTRRVVVAPAS